MYPSNSSRLFVFAYFSPKIWASVGTAIVSIAGIVFFGERLDMAKIICLTLILLGVVGLELSGDH
jgi:multidrug transporter EmrE-like cation transporter